MHNDLPYCDRRTWIGSVVQFADTRAGAHDWRPNCRLMCIRSVEMPNSDSTPCPGPHRSRTDPSDFWLLPDTRVAGRHYSGSVGSLNRTPNLMLPCPDWGNRVWHGRVDAGVH